MRGSDQYMHLPGLTKCDAINILHSLSCRLQILEAERLLLTFENPPTQSLSRKGISLRLDVTRTMGMR